MQCQTEKETREELLSRRSVIFKQALCHCAGHVDPLGQASSALQLRGKPGMLDTVRVISPDLCCLDKIFDMGFP